MRILWGALLASSGIYAAILGFKVVTPPPHVNLPPMFPMVFAAVAVGIVAMSFVLPKTIYKQTAARMTVRIEEEPVPGVFAAGYREAAPERKVFADAEEAWRKAAACYMTPLILGLALSEATSLLGFVLGFLGFPATVWAPFMVVGSALIAIRFPTEARVTEAFEAARGASFPGRDRGQG